MTTQNAPGIALLKAVDYRPPINQIVHFGGTLSLIGAGFGGAGVNLSAMTATIAISPDCDPNQKTRYFAGVVSGTAYCVAALFAGVFSVFVKLIAEALLIKISIPPNAVAACSIAEVI